MTSKYCERNGHKQPYATPRDTRVMCIDCGDEFHYEPKLQSGHGDVMEATAGLEDALARFQGDGHPEAKLSNPKDAIGAGKLSLHLVPPCTKRYAALAFTEGALKYGKFNWRVAGIRMSVYLDAMERHLDKVKDGEWVDGDSLPPNDDGTAQGTGVPHLGSIIACCGIILDAFECGKLTDDRSPRSPNSAATLDAMAEHVAHLKKLFASHHPHQHTIADENPVE